MEIYTIGYEPMGESIIFFIIGDNNILFSGVIDCYEKENINKTVEILKEKDVESLDFICLTHPDIDHCTGLEKILERANQKTYIIYPGNLFDRVEEYGGATKKAIRKLSENLSMNKNNSKKINRINSCIGKKEIIPLKRIGYKDVNTGYTYPLIINTYTPITTIIDRYSAKRFLNKNASPTTHNELSIITSIAIGDFKMLLCGDVENETLELWKKDWNEDDKKFFSDVIDYLKIPHHTSKGSNLLLSSLNDIKIFSNSVTTVFRKWDLPDKQLIREYKKKSDKLYCTGHIEEEKNSEEYGIVKLTIDMFNNTIKEELTSNVEEIKL